MNGLSPWRRAWPVWLAGAALALLPLDGALAVERGALEAAIVFNLLQFVEWPNESALPDGSPLTLCLRGDSPLMAPARLLEGRAVRRMALHVARLDGPAHACQAVYIDSVSAEQDARSAAHDPALVIGASDYRPAARASIQLVFAEGRLAFDIDQRKAQQSGLSISSRLLRLARTVSE
ncbi:MAG: YfiR family protein [Burkholderiales bacterium]|nr:YfiR family protein [Burkholderiales bacterium]